MPKTPIPALLLAALTAAVLSLSTPPSTAAADSTPTTAPFTQLLTSADRGLNIETWQITGHEVTPDCPASWALHKYALHGGKQEGVDVIVFNNGKLRLTVCPTRGMGILSVTSGDVRLGWDSPVKETVNPTHINLQSRGGLGWLEGFNEWLVRCGLESNGHPGTDKFVNNVGEEATMELTLHGKIANIPASEVEVVVERQSPWRIHVRGRVDERMFYGPKLELWTDVSAEPGSNSFRVEDVVTNRGAAEQEFQVLYHTNYGRPLLEEGSTVLLAAERVTPFNDNAARGIKDYSRYAGPKLGFIEQVYCVRPLADAEGRTTAVLQNAKKDRAVSLAWSTKELPFFTVWKNTAAEADGYVTGLEPGTGYPWNRRIERQNGRVPKLAAGASRRFAIDFTIHAGADQVKQAADRVAAIQGNKPAVLDETPPKVE